MERGAAGLTGAMAAIIATLGWAEISAVEAAENALRKLCLSPRGALCIRVRNKDT